MKVQKANTIIEVEATGTYYEEFTDYYTYAIDEYPPAFDDDNLEVWNEEAKKMILEDIYRTHAQSYYHDIQMFLVYEFQGKKWRAEI